MLCVMQLLYCLGSLCHLTAVWSQQKSTIFAFQHFSPTVSLWCVWKCDQCGVYQFTPWKKWLKLAVWFVGWLATRSLQVRGWRLLLSWGECDGQLRVEERGGQRWGGWAERVAGAGIASAQTCWGAIAPKHQEWANLSHPLHQLPP